MPITEITRPSGTWALYTGITVLDPDGWDRANFQESWNEPITLAEFHRRVRLSTTYRTER